MPSFLLSSFPLVLSRRAHQRALSEKWRPADSDDRRRDFPHKVVSNDTERDGQSRYLIDVMT